MIRVVHYAPSTAGTRGGAIRDSHRNITVAGHNGREGICPDPAPDARRFAFSGGSTADRSQAKAYCILPFDPDNPRSIHVRFG